jgi:glycosyltransferase involved in cell wall biosynthesis
MRNRVIAKGIPAQRVIVVRDGASQLEAPPDANHPAVQQIRSGCQFVVMHAGNMGFAGAWEALLRAIAKVQQEDGIRFVFVGDGAVRPLIERSINGMPNVRLLPYFPEAALPHVLWAADLHLVTLRHGLEGLVVPSKTYPLLMIGRPILAVVPKTSDIARIVERYQCGILADPDDPEQIRQAILWARDHPSALREMGERARAAGRQFDREALAEEFEGILTDRVKHRDSPR